MNKEEVLEVKKLGELLDGMNLSQLKQITDTVIRLREVGEEMVELTTDDKLWILSRALERAHAHGNGLDYFQVEELLERIGKE